MIKECIKKNVEENVLRNCTKIDNAEDEMGSLVYDDGHDDFDNDYSDMCYIIASLKKSMIRYMRNNKKISKLEKVSYENYMVREQVLRHYI